MPLMNRLNARTGETLKAGKQNDGASLHLHKRKDDDAQWLYRSTIHGYCREIRLRNIERYFLKTNMGNTMVLCFA